MRLLIAAAMILVVFGAQAEPLTYYYFKTPIALQPIEGQYARYTPPAAQRAEVVAAAVPGLTLLEERAWGIEGWTRVALAEGTLKLAGADDQNATLAANGGGSYASPVFRGADGGPMTIPPRILVGFDLQAPAERCIDLIRLHCGQDSVIKLLDEDTCLYLVEVAATDGLTVLSQANALAIEESVRLAEPDMLFTGRSDLIPNDRFFVNCWGLRNIGQSGGLVDFDMDAEEAWDVTTGDPNVIVVVLDTGVEFPHLDLNQIPGIDTTSEVGDGNPINSFDNHGTPVAGCISGTINNVVGTVGVAPTCKTASARTFISNNANGNWSSSASWTVNSLVWARSIGARVTNNSNGYGFTSSAIASTYNSLRNQNQIVHFASAGNDSSNDLSYPASLSTVNAISSVERSGSLSSFSNFNLNLSYAAPGTSIYTTDRTGSDGWNNGAWTFASGTSFASPYAAGVAALALSVNPNLSPDQVDAVMTIGAIDYGLLGFDSSYGHGLVNAANSVILADLFRIDLFADAVITIADFDQAVTCIEAQLGTCVTADFDASGQADIIDFAWFQTAYSTIGSF